MCFFSKKSNDSCLVFVLNLSILVIEYPVYALKIFFLGGNVEVINFHNLIFHFVP